MLVTAWVCLAPLSTGVSPFGAAAGGSSGRTANSTLCTSPGLGSSRERVLSTLHSEGFPDCAPAAMRAQLLDEGQHLRSPHTMLRILAEQGEVQERRAQLVHPP